MWWRSGFRYRGQPRCAVSIRYTTRRYVWRSQNCTTVKKKGKTNGVSKDLELVGTNLGSVPLRSRRLVPVQWIGMHHTKPIISSVPPQWYQATRRFYGGKRRPSGQGGQRCLGRKRSQGAHIPYRLLVCRTGQGHDASWSFWRFI